MKNQIQEERNNSKKIQRICIAIVIILVLYVIYWSSVEKIAFLEDHSPF